MNLVEVTDLVKYYGDFLALDHFNLSVKKGEIYGLLGPNGCGKTTAINCILSLLKFNQGSVSIFGQTMTASNYEVKKRIGLVMQNIGVYDELTVYENIDYFCGLYINDREDRKQKVQKALAFVELENFVDFKPKQLSGGLLRRLNLACGIAHDPDLIILDEPTVAVDPQSRNKILQGIKYLRDQGKTIIYTTHYMEEVEALCDHITIMDHGKELVSGAKEQIKAHSQSGDTIEIESYDIQPELIQHIQHLESVVEVKATDKGLWIKLAKGSQDLLQILLLCDQSATDILNISVTKPSLNDVFLEITGKELRDHA